MSETNHTNAGAEAPLKTGAPKTGAPETGAPETGAPKANIWRRFPSWGILAMEAYPVPLTDGTFIYATLENGADPKDPHLYVATITRETSTGSGTRYEDLRQHPFDDLIEALLYLENVDLSEFGITNE